VSAPAREILFPDPLRRRKLKEAVIFTPADLAVSLNEFGVSAEDLAPLIIQCGEANIDNSDTNPVDLVRRPIVRAGDHLVVPLPTVLLDALRNEILHLVTESEAVAEVAELYRDTIWRMGTSALTRLGCEQIIPPFPIEPLSHLREGFFQFDRDKIMHVCLATDDLSDYDFEKPFCTFKIERQTIDDLLFRHERIRCQAFSIAHGAPNEFMFLLLLQDVGRGLIAANPVQSEDTLVLTMTVADLHTISMLNEDELTLWKYAKALRRIKNSSALISWGQLDIFKAYRSWNYSFYFSDDALPNLISIVPDGAGALRREVQQKLNIHSTRTYRDNRILEVAALHDARVIPEYVVIKDLGQRVAILLEGYPIPLWFVGPESGGPEDGEYHSLYAEIADALAYWFWELSPSLVPQFGQIELSVECIVFRLKVVPDSRWFLFSDTSHEETAESLMTVETDVGNAEVAITLEAGLGQLLCTPDNRGERQLIRHLLIAVRKIIAHHIHNQISDEWVDETIERHMPLGRKKRFFFLDMSNNPCLDPTGLPLFRKIQSEDKNEILDNLGNYFVERIGRGIIPPENRKSVIDLAVTLAFKEFESTVASLAPEGVLETFIGLHETCIQQRHLDRLTIPTRIACFGPQSESVEHTNKEIQENAAASVACRFIIEYIAAKPSNGLRPISMSVIDSLQALAETIVIFGTTSDLFQYELAEIDLEILPSNRLAIDMDEYTLALQAFWPSHVADVVDTAEANYERHWIDTSTEPVPDIASRLEEAFTAEFGYSLTDFILLVSKAIELGGNQDCPAPRFPEAEFHDILTSELAWPKDRVISAIDQLALRPRPDFLSPPEPYLRKDVYPWRTNRKLSYIRKPFLKRESGGLSEILYGTRHLYEAGMQLLGLCMDGRLNATSGAMNRLMGILRSKDGLNFNSIVAENYKKDSEVIVKENVKKIRTNEGVKKPPGDIDVLVADTSDKKLLVIECKDMSAAFQPYDVNSELTRLFVDKGSHKSTLTKHKARIEWTIIHKREVLEWLGVADKDGWEVEGRIVTNRRSLTKYIRTSPIPVVVLRDIPGQ